MERRRVFKTAAALVTCSLLVYQGSVTFNFQESSSGTVQVSDLSIVPVTKRSLNGSERTKNVDTNITLEDIFISVKTTRHYQYTRLPLILKTWFQLAKEQIWFFTDTDNRIHQLQTKGHMVNTNCSSTHQRPHLCCKTSVEYDRYLESGKKWWCHFDDDNYVNVPRLVTTLQKYNYMKDWYIGRKSVNNPIQIFRRKDEEVLEEDAFWFATGGAGFCISKSLGLKLLPIASGGRFISVCEKIKLPDDVSMGFVIEHKVNVKMTVVSEFHSHLEPMKLLKPETLKDQISFGYAKLNSTDWNVLDVPGFDVEYDPTRFLSLHCFLYPHFKFCPR